jgi:RNA polymerase sigma-70 factor, ECF subfamily
MNRATEATWDDSLILSEIRRKNYRRALEGLARSYAAQLGRLCLAMTGSQAEAEELVQDVLIAAFNALPRFEGRAGLRTWLYTIARRTCGRAMQKRNRRWRLLARTDVAPTPSDDPLQVAIVAGERERLRRALAELSAAQQETLLLRYVGALSYREVAEVCGIREDAARQRASAGLRLLRRQLEPEERAALEGASR